MDDGQALLFGDDVAGRDRVAPLAPEILGIPRNLPGRSQLDSHGSQGIALIFPGFSCQRARLRGRSRQRPGLPVDHIHVGPCSHHHLVLELQVHVLPFAQLQAGLVQRANGTQHSVGWRAPSPQPHHRGPAQCVQPVAGVDSLRRTPDPPDARTVDALCPSCLYLAVHQREVVHQLDASRGGQCRLKITAQGLAAHQRHRSLEMQRRIPILPLSVLVDPAQVVAQKVVEESLATVKHIAQLPFHGLPVFFVLLNHRH